MSAKGVAARGRRWPPARVAASVAVLAVAALLVFQAWFWLERQRARAAHMEDRKAYAARTVEELGAVPAELRESSGLAVSRTQPGILWSHNDSGDGPTLYAIDPSGRLLASVGLEGAAAVDWEDLAGGPCPVSLVMATAAVGTLDRSCLYVADTGDNNRRRNALTVYVVAEPTLDGTETPRAVAARSFRYRYPDGPQDSEAFAVLPNGDAVIVTKGYTGTVDFYGISAARIARALGSSEVLTAEHAGSAGIEPDGRTGRLVTGAAVSPDGTTLAVRTYNEVFFYTAVRSGEGARRWRDLGRPCFLGNREPQGEAIDYLDDETLALTSERARGVPGLIQRVKC